MSSDGSQARVAASGWPRKVGLALVMLGALSVSVRGQVLAVEPMLGAGMGVVFALTNDLAALLALNEIVTAGAGGGFVRRWAWSVLLLAGGSGAGLNTWHAIAGGWLPVGWAVLVGAGPVVLAALLSHLVALALSPVRAVTADAESTPPAESVAVSAEASVAPRSGAAPARALTAVPAPPAVVTASSTGTGSRAGSRTAGEPDERVQRLLALLAEGVPLSGASAAEALGCSERTGRRALRHAEQLHAQHDRHNNVPALPFPVADAPAGAVR